MTTFFTADLHLNYPKVNTYEKRPFNSVEEGTEFFIGRWNEQVSSEDTVELLGDFAYGSYDELVAILERLNGKINLTLGNHDDLSICTKLYEQGYFNELNMVGKVMQIRDDLTFKLTHYPLDIGTRATIFNVHGHLHSRPSILPNQLNVSVESPILGYEPYFFMPTLENLVEYADRKAEEIKHYYRSWNGNLYSSKG